MPSDSSGAFGTSTTGAPDPETIRDCVDRIVRSTGCLRSQRMVRFLRFAVEKTLEGNDDELKEYAVGVEVFDRGESFDPAADNIVRVEANRLRSKLKGYYETDGAGDPVVVDFPRGGYVPAFHAASTRGTESGTDVGDAAPPTQAGLYEERGRRHLLRGTEQEIGKALACFEQWRADAPDKTGSYVGLACARMALAELGFDPPRSLLDAAGEALGRALRLNDSDARTHSALGRLRMLECDWAAAHSATQLAVSLDGDSVQARVCRGLLFTRLGRFGEAARELERAVELDPMDPAVRVALADAHYFSREPGKALDQAQATIYFEPDFYPAFVTAGLAYAAEGAFADAVTSLDHAVDLSGNAPRVLAALAGVRAVAGHSDGAEEILAVLEQRREKRYVAPSGLAQVLAALGREDALDWLEKALDEGDPGLAELGVDPRFDGCRAEPRFVAVLGKVGLHR